MADKKKLPLAKPLITSWQWHASLFSILSDDENAKKWIFSNYIQLRCYDIEERWTGDTILLTDMMPGSSSLKQCPYLIQYMKVKSESEVSQSCPTLDDPMDCSLPGSSVHGIFQARVLEGVAIKENTTTLLECSFQIARSSIEQ